MKGNPVTTLSAQCQNCSCLYEYDSVTMEQTETSEVSEHCSDRTCDCHAAQGIPTPTKDELLQKLTQGNVVYRYNNVWGVYEFLRPDGTWEEFAPSELDQDMLEAMDMHGYQYHDDTAAYCDQDA